MAYIEIGALVQPVDSQIRLSSRESSTMTLSYSFRTCPSLTYSYPSNKLQIRTKTDKASNASNKKSKISQNVSHCTSAIALFQLRSKAFESRKEKYLK